MDREGALTDHQPASPVITSDRVNGTPVHGAGGTQIGEIDHILIEKVSGRITYAVMFFGGFLGLGQDQYPIPSAALEYDPELGVYVAGLTEDQLCAAPERPEDWAHDRRWEETAHAHFGLPFYWI